MADNLRQALTEVITNLMSTNLAERQLAEQQLEALQVTDEYGIHLTELTLDADGHLPLRQMAALLLKQYVDSHWSADADKFKEPEATPKAKAAIRAVLPHGLKESVSKVRSSVAYCISAIAHWDWPDQWPELFDLLTTALRGGANEFAVHGAVRVLKEFARDLSDAQIPRVAPVVLPDMYRIFMEHETYGVRTRARAIEIFTTVTSMLCTVGEVNKSLSKTLLEPILPAFTEALVSGLSLPDDSHASDPGLKTEILKALTVLIKNVPKDMAQWLPQILPSVWATLTSSADKYVREVVNEGDGGDDGEEEEEVDSEGEVVGFENLVFGIFEFVHVLIESTKFAGAVKSGLPDLMYYIVLYMQITNDQCEKWTENPDKFVEDEDEDSFTYSVRISSQDLLTALFEDFEEECCASLANTLERHLRDSETAKGAGNPNFWKHREAAMLALGTVHKNVERQLHAGAMAGFDVGAFLETVVLADVVNPASPFLLGRCLWLASKFPNRLSQQPSMGDSNQASPMGRFIEAVVRGLQADQIAVVRISAVRAIWGFFSYLRIKKTTTGQNARFDVEQRSLLLPVLPATVDALVDMCTAFNAASDVLALVLENLTVVLACDPKFTASYEAKVSPLIIAVFLKYSSDPVVASLVQDIFRVLSQTKGCLEPLEARLVPTLSSILEAPVSEGCGVKQNASAAVTTGLKAVTLDVMQTVVRASAHVKGKPDSLSELLMARAFPAALRATTGTEDNAVMQSGGECLRAFVSVSPEQVCSFADPDGKSGLWYMVQVAGRLLDPVGSEFAATFVGRLVTTLIQKTGIERLGGDNLDMLLKAVLSKLQRSSTLSVVQSLLMVYAQLMHTHLRDVIAFLCSVPGPGGETALEFVLGQWVERQFHFYGAYETKVSIVALAKLLSHAVVNNDARLQDINVRGDLVFRPEAAATSRTRSQKRLNPDQWTSIPVLVKILKLILQELASNMDEAVEDGDEEEEDDDDDENSDDNEVGAVLSPDSNRIASKVAMAEVLDDEDDDEDEDDPDVLADPIYSISLKKYLTEFVVEFCQQPYFQHHFALHLNAAERSTLLSVGVRLE